MKGKGEGSFLPKIRKRFMMGNYGNASASTRELQQDNRMDSCCDAAVLISSGTKGLLKVGEIGDGQSDGTEDTQPGTRFP